MKKLQKAAGWATIVIGFLILITGMIFHSPKETLFGFIGGFDVGIGILSKMFLSQSK